MMKKKEESRLSESYVMGVVALVFLVIGYQVALFVHRAAVLKIEAERDSPDTVYVYKTRETGRSTSKASGTTEYKPASHGPHAAAVRRNLPRRTVESFRFNPNTVSEDDLCRLGFTLKQAHSIVNYRQKGGRFHRKEDFAKSFVVSDSIYRRLEPFIDIPLLDLNLADSAAFDALPGIGGWFASKIVAHRDALKGYSYKEQLMDIWKLDRDKYDALSDLVTVSPENTVPYPLWNLPAEALCRHPYIRNREIADAIVLYRKNVPKSNWTVQGLLDAGIISSDAASKLCRCVIEQP